MKLTAKSLINSLTKSSSKERANTTAVFFKIGPGQYGEGDKFLGVRVPDIRQIIKDYSELSVSELEYILAHKYHEVRLAGFLILANLAKKANKDKNKNEQLRLAKLYLKNIKWANNWDIIDTSAEHVLGPIYGQDYKFLKKMSSSKNLWDRRIAVLSTFYWIRKNQFAEIESVSTWLLNDQEDLIHKATGWLLREVGKKDIEFLRNFLTKHADKMPRTMLRYSIEKMSKSEQKKWRDIKGSKIT